MAVLDKRLVAVLVGLCAITLVQLGVESFDAPAARASAPNPLLTSAVITVALLKVRVIMREFMEVRHAPLLLGRLTDLWLVLTGVSLLGCYLVGTALGHG